MLKNYVDENTEVRMLKNYVDENTEVRMLKNHVDENTEVRMLRKTSMYALLDGSIITANEKGSNPSPFRRQY